MERSSVAASLAVVVVMILGRGTSASGVLPALSCDPDCSGTSNGDKVVNPWDCTEFYYCIDGAPTDHPTSCPEGNYFDQADQACEAGTCDSICGPGTSGCPLTCSSSLIMVGDAFDCSTYYFCTPEGSSEAQFCPADRPYFDGRFCVNDDSVCCNGYCEPYCDGSGFAQVPDPLDCTKYYICENTEGIPGENEHFSCGSGEYFNIAAGQCEWGLYLPCPVLCDAAKGMWFQHHLKH